MRGIGRLRTSEAERTAAAPFSVMGPVTSVATAMTSAGAWPIAMPRPCSPAHSSISMSLRPSPMAITCVRATSCSSRTRSMAVALFTPSGAMSSHAVQPME